MKNKLKVFHVGRSATQFLICPQCAKPLQRYDIEEFMTCPYCDHPFEFSAELEQFMLQPLVNEWMRQMSTHRHERLSGYVDP